MEQIRIKGLFSIYVDYDYTPAKFSDPDKLEIHGVEFHEDLIDLFDSFKTTEQIMDAIRDRIREMHR